MVSAPAPPISMLERASAPEFKHLQKTRYARTSRSPLCLVSLFERILKTSKISTRQMQKQRRSIGTQEAFCKTGRARVRPVLQNASCVPMLRRCFQDKAYAITFRSPCTALPCAICFGSCVLCVNAFFGYPLQLHCACVSSAFRLPKLCGRSCCTCSRKNTSAVGVHGGLLVKLCAYWNCV